MFLYTISCNNYDEYILYLNSHIKLYEICNSMISYTVDRCIKYINKENSNKFIISINKIKDCLLQQIQQDVENKFITLTLKEDILSILDDLLFLLYVKYTSTGNSVRTIMLQVYNKIYNYKKVDNLHNNIKLFCQKYDTQAVFYYLCSLLSSIPNTCFTTDIALVDKQNFVNINIVNEVNFILVDNIDIILYYFAYRPVTAFNLILFLLCDNSSNITALKSSIDSMKVLPVIYSEVNTNILARLAKCDFEILHSEIMQQIMKNSNTKNNMQQISNALQDIFIYARNMIDYLNKKITLEQLMYNTIAKKFNLKDAIKATKDSYNLTDRVISNMKKFNEAELPLDLLNFFNDEDDNDIKLYLIVLKTCRDYFKNIC